MTKKTKGIEQMLGEIEDIIRVLEGDEKSLEESFQLYEEGMNIVKAVGERLDKVEKELVTWGEESDEQGNL